MAGNFSKSLMLSSLHPLTHNLSLSAIRAYVNKYAHS